MKLTTQEFTNLTGAICTITGRLEAHIDDLMDNGRFEEAMEHLDDLLYMHKLMPLHASENWSERWVSMKQECREHLVNS